MKYIAIAFVGMLLFTVRAAASISSPDGSVSVSVSVGNETLTYNVSHHGRPLLEASPLGLVTSTGDFSAGLRLVGESPVTSVRHEYDLPIGKRSRVAYEANRATVTVANKARQRLSVVFQVSNDGVALAYRLHESASSEVVVQREITGFALPTHARLFLLPMHVARSGWSRTNPSYEAHYRIDRPVGEPSPDGQGWCFPGLFSVGEDGWVLLSETGVDGRYCGTHLAHDSSGGVYRIAFPQHDENLPADPIEPTVAGDAQLPWRIIIVGQTLAPIVASTLPTDLVEPKYEAPQASAPGRAAWSWLALKDDQNTYETQRRFIDMAADLRFEYVLIDALWDQKIGRDKIGELVDYARGKNVGVLLWYNSNGAWNDAPQSPRDCMHTPAARAKEMAWLRDIGVKGIKVDFFGGDKQSGMQLYQDLLTDAATYGLCVNFHGTTLPRGWERMYPSFVTNEAVMGMEFCTFAQENADLQPQHCTVLPFTRNTVGPMDFTPCLLSKRLGPANSGPRRRTTDGFELALPVLFFSGIQHFGVTPAQIEAQPPFARDFLRKVPVTWDETRFVDGYPGRFAVLARRNGDQWFIAAINGENAARPLTLHVDFAGPGPWTLLTDSENGTALDTAVARSNDNTVQITLQPRGGAVLWRPDGQGD